MPIPGWKRLRRLLSGTIQPRTACEVCGRGFTPGKMTTACLDHHGDSARGWLCGSCNVGLGLAGENPSILRAMASYLESRPHAVRRPLIR